MLKLKKHIRFSVGSLIKAAAVMRKSKPACSKMNNNKETLHAKNLYMVDLSIVPTMAHHLLKEEIKDTRGVIRIHKSKNDRQHDDKKINDKRTHNDLHIKIKKPSTIN
jgi:hypothetical protein